MPWYAGIILILFNELCIDFLDVKTDYAFKRVFGSENSKPVLIGFLNAILDYQGEYAIVELTIVDSYQIPRLEGMKDTYVDVKAVLANGKHVIIEMQRPVSSTNATAL